MKTLSNALLTELGLTVTRPGYLVQIAFPSYTYTLSTIGDITWNSKVWVGADVRVTGLGQDGTGNSSGSLILGNTDNAYGTIVLTDGASDIPVDIFVVYAGATALGDPVQVFSGVLDGADITTRSVTLGIVSQGNATLFSPRVFINKAAGFSHLMPQGTPLPINGEKFILTGKAI